MNNAITQQALESAIERDWQDQIKYPHRKGWVKVIERLTGMYCLLLWSNANNDVISDCQTLMQVALQHNIWEHRND